jgi:simple sugar transport system substrate-binding protein
MKPLVRFLSLAFLAIVISGCTPRVQSQQPQPGQKKLKFIFITCVVHEDFFVTVKKGMEDAARMMDVECTFTGTEGVDIVAQTEMVRKAIHDGYDGIALNIMDPVGFDEVIREAADARIPLVSFNIDDRSTPNTRLSTVSQRLYEAGVIMGKEAGKFIPDGSEILMTMHDKGVSALEDRLHGAQDGLREAGLSHVKWEVAITGNTVAGSSDVILRALQEHPQIKVILCTGQADTEGAGITIDKHFNGQGYQAAGFDLSPGILNSIRKGYIAFTIDQQPYTQGFYPVIQLTLLKRYGLMPSNMDTGATLITLQNAESVLELSKQHYR